MRRLYGGFALLKQLTASFVLTVMTVCGAAEVRSEQPKWIIVVDGWWSADFARGGCDQAKELYKEDKELIAQVGCVGDALCPSMMPRYEACSILVDPGTAARDFEDELMTQFAVNPDCKGAAFGRFYGPYDSSPALDAALADKHAWTLFVNFEVGGATQPWNLQDHGFRIFLHGEGSTPAKVAAEICVIVSGKGGTILP